MLKNQYFLLLLITILIALISFGLAGYVQIVTSRPTTLSMAKPSYLLAPIPTISELEVILKNPKLKEMKSISNFFAPIVVGEKGRPNPFMPFMKKETKK